MGCVYRARNKINGKSYIGKTIQDLTRRKYEHRCSAKNGGTSVFWRAIRKYGWDSFVWSVLYESDDFDKLNEKEIKAIAKFNSLAPKGYNVAEGGEGPNKCKRSAETKEKIRQANLGKKKSEETKTKMSQSQKKRHKKNGGHSAETKAKIGLANKGKKRSKKLRKHLSEVCSGWIHTDEAKEKIRKAGMGRKHTDESKERIRQAKFGNKFSLGNKHSEETKAKISKARKGKKLSEEHKRKLSESHKGHKPSVETRKKLSASLRLAYKEGRR